MMPPLRDLAALYAAGALSAEERAHFLMRLASAPPADRDECAAIQETAALLSRSVRPLAVPDGVREAIVHTAGSDPDRHEHGFSFIAANEHWQQHPVLPGISMKVLAIDHVKGSVTLLARLAPDTAFPPHRHIGAEQTLVLSGDLRSGGRRLGPGDFYFAAAGSEHSDAYSEGGCTAVLVVDLRDYAHL